MENQPKININSNLDSKNFTSKIIRSLYKPLIEADATCGLVFEPVCESRGVSDLDSIFLAHTLNTTFE